MELSISHDIKDESLEAKAEWFQSMTLQERMDYFCEFTDFLIELNPDLLKGKDAEPIEGRVLVLSKT
jgi:hypothetical protein